jgi:hypothetical protein
MRLLPNDNLPISILPSNNINRLDASFMYFQLEKSNENDQHEQSGTIIVYRGQLLVPDQFEKLRKSVNGGFLSINNFMSTTMNRNMALIYSGGGLQSPINESILFEITVFS